MCNKAITKNGETLESVPDCYKNQKLFNQAVVHAKEFVPECYKTQEMLNKVVHRYLYVFDSVPDQYKTQ